MLIPKEHPGEWLHFVEREDNEGLTLLELKEKYQKEKILYENYITNFEQHQLMLAQMAAGGSAKVKKAYEQNAYGNKFAIRLNIPSDGFTSILGLEQDGVAAAATWTIDWGDGNTESGTGAPSHTWTTAGTYDVLISPGGWNGFNQVDHGTTLEMRNTFVDVLHWGSNQWKSMTRTFNGCVNITTFSATDAPDLTILEDMFKTFAQAENFNSDISSWNVSNCTLFQDTFFNATSFNQPLNSWDVSSAESFSQMFRGATVFNQPIGSWDVSNVTNCQNMFHSARDFNQDIGDWRFTVIDRINGMFAYTTNFNNGGSDNIKNWTMGTCRVYQGAFNSAAAFNQPIGDWDTGSATNMKEVFALGVFNQDISSWDMTNVTTIFGMFRDCVFNQPLDSWVFTKLQFTKNCFKNNRVFNQDLNSWNMEKVTTMDSMFFGAYEFNGNITGWITDKVGDIDFMFYEALVFNQDIGGWNLPLLTTCKAVFQGADTFNQDISSWDMNGVTRTQDMFRDAILFNQDISGWDTSTIQNMNDMFNGATSFSQDLGGWDVSSLTTATQMFLTSGMTVANYDNLLNGWVNSSRQADVTFSNDLQSTAATSGVARAAIIATPWTVNDGGQI